MDELKYYSGTFFFIKLLTSVFKVDFEYIRLLFYTVWTSLSFYLLFIYLFLNTNLYEYYCPLIVHTINCVFIYELSFHRPDKAHSIHHIFTIILQVIAYYSGFLGKTEHLILCNTSHLGFLSSIFSSLLTISTKRNSIYKHIIKKYYYNTYLISKIGGMILYYIILGTSDILIFSYNFLFVFILYFSIHIIQLYFSWKIYMKLRTNSPGKNIDSSDKIMECYVCNREDVGKGVPINKVCKICHQTICIAHYGINGYCTCCSEEKKEL